MLLEHRGLSVRMQKLDPYINVDPGTMSPYQHGEVYVLDDGSETDLDLGHYERFTNSPLNSGFQLHDGPDLSVGDQQGTARRVLGQTVQVIPHITNEIKAAVHKPAGAASMWSSPKSAAPSATSKASRSSRPYANSRSTSARKTACTSISPGALSEGGRRVEDEADAAIGRPIAQIGVQPDIFICRTERALSRDDRATRSPCFATCRSRR